MNPEYRRQSTQWKAADEERRQARAESHPPDLTWSHMGKAVDPFQAPLKTKRARALFRKLHTTH